MNGRMLADTPSIRESILPGVKLEQFAMERMQSTWENLVDFNLSESGVHPLTPRELLGDDALDVVLDQPLVYTQSNGTPELRTLIADLYPGATPDHIQVTNGGSEANYLAVWRLVEPGDEVAMLVPNYMQTWGLVRAFGGTIREWPLIEDRDGRPLAPRPRRSSRASSPIARALIIICTPNNPTGARLTAGELDRDRGHRRASRQRGSSQTRSIAAPSSTRHETPSMWGRGERVIVTSGLSKAYGLPGLRIGWIVGAAAFVASTWSYHDYTTIAPGALERSAGARRARTRRKRPALLERTRGILRANLPLIEAWLQRPRPGVLVDRARGRRHHLRPLQLPDQLDRARHAAARREERAGRAGRSLRDGRLSAARLRRAAGLSAPGARSRPRAAVDAAARACRSAAAPGRVQRK